MDYKETLDHLYTRLPMFSKVGASAMTKDLANTIALCGLLDNPQNKFKSVHVGGTNGKGSTSHMLAAILQTAGYKVGLYTSPHLKDFRERIRVNGKMINEWEVTGFVGRHREDIERLNPSFFEVTVALAFEIFAREQVDIAIIEVGLGGRLDSTNVISPILSVITNIGWDHMNILGDTLQLIAAEKAGIIKPNTPVIISEYQSEVAEIFLQKAQQENARLLFASDDWDVEIETNDQKAADAPGTLNIIAFPQKNSLTTQYLQLDLTGTYQLKNIKGVLSAVNRLRLLDFFITDFHIQTALRQVRSLTGLHGRWETIGNTPLTICDTGHNPEGIREVLKNIALVGYDRLHMVIGMVNDKDSGKILSMLPRKAAYYFCKPGIPRGLDAHELKDRAEEFKLYGSVYPSVNDALEAARAAAYLNDLVFVGGSTFVVAEVV